MDRPNILFFVVDEMRADHMGCAGNAIVRTPHLDRLASEGACFPRAYCNNPICMPARTTMFTGLLPRDHGVWHNNMEFRGPLPLMPALLAEAGYITHSVGKLHLSRWLPGPEIEGDTARFPEALKAWNEGRVRAVPPGYCGFQSVDFVGGHGHYVFGDYFEWLKTQVPDPRRALGPAGALEPPSGAPDCWKMGLPARLHYNRWIADRAIGLIERAHDARRPFFLWCSFPDPHVPFAAPAPWCDMYRPEAMPLPRRSEEEIGRLPPYYAGTMAGRIRPNNVRGGRIPDAHWQEMLALTLGMISFVDAEIGRVLARLEALGLRGNTLIVFVSDHGDMMGDHWMMGKGPFMFEGCVRIPLIFSGPGIRAGRRPEGLACQIDLLPTVLDYAGVQAPGEQRLAMKDHPYLIGQVVPLRVWPGQNLRPVLEGRADRLREAVVIENDEPWVGLKIRTLVTDRHKLTMYAGQDFGELFDLAADPDELNNLWAEPAARGLRADLTARLLHEDTRLAPWTPVPWWNA